MLCTVRLFVMISFFSLTLVLIGCSKPVPIDLVEKLEKPNTTNTKIGFVTLFDSNNEQVKFLSRETEKENCKDPKKCKEVENTYSIKGENAKEIKEVSAVSKVVHIDGIFLLYVSNAFTPDGDGVKDLLGPSGQGLAYADYEFTVFDRWASPVFRTNDWREQWSGSGLGGGPAVQGVYAWRLKAKDRYRGHRKEAMGHVTLVR